MSWKCNRLIIISSTWPELEKFRLNLLQVLIFIICFFQRFWTTNLTLFVSISKVSTVRVSQDLHLEPFRLGKQSRTFSRLLKRQNNWYNPLFILERKNYIFCVTNHITKGSLPHAFSTYFYCMVLRFRRIYFGWLKPT